MSARVPSEDVLQVRRRPRSALVLRIVLGAAVVTAVAWFAGSPPQLPVSAEQISASVPAGQSIYVGVFAPDSDFKRTLHLSGVKVHTTSNTEVTVVPLLCHGGAVGVTTEPETFCTELVNPEGQTFQAGDDIVLKISSELPSIAVVDRVRLGYRDGLQWGTHEAGKGVVVRVLAR